MKGVDTTFLIDLLRGDATARQKAIELDQEGTVCTTEANVYELVQGISHKAPDKERAMRELEMLLVRLSVFPLGREAATRAGQISARLMAEGRMTDDVDCLVAGILLANGCETIVTRNVKHFERISELAVERY